MLLVHILAGALAIVAGTVALSARKGGAGHRAAGAVFVWTMLTMALSGSAVAFGKDGIANPNFIGGLTAIYFVVTGFTTLRPASASGKVITWAGIVLIVPLVALELSLAVQAFSRPSLSLDGVPAPMFVFLAAAKVIGVIGDIRVVRFEPPRGLARLRRHLWRMCFGFFIAAGSFFSIRERVAMILPEPFLDAPVRMLPIPLIFIGMFYWLWRYRDKPAHPSHQAMVGAQRRDNTQLSAGVSGRSE